jgi:hypothetical protein
MSDSDRKDAGTLVRLTEQDVVRAAELEAFVKREFELKRTMTFGEWIRHVKDSHEQLLRLVATVPVRTPPVQIEFTRHREDGACILTVYELPADVRRILVDGDEVTGKVWGFRLDTDSQREEHVSSKQLSSGFCIVVAQTDSTSNNS